uniref:Mesencephalic astrocyte-derived neurotrophic factor homolog n=1 Tax=Panagrellus redivivus TaxID=6233 RepID=A0A7E4VYM0_PANRE
MKSVLVFLALLVAVLAQQDKCEVCTKVLKDVIAKIPSDKTSNQNAITAIIREHCGGTRNKENKFCNYIGALPESATSVINEVSKPLSWSMPAEKVCDKLKAMDSQICDLKFDKEVDWNTVDLKKLKVKDLKKILENWGEVCKGCSEKTDFVARVNELKPKYVKSEL